MASYRHLINMYQINFGACWVNFKVIWHTECNKQGIMILPTGQSQKIANSLILMCYLGIRVYTSVVVFDSI